jgi:YidC/Oxa1 family membrane protein insertase
MDFLYSIIIFPIEQIIEIFYTLFYKVFEIQGISVIGVSFAFTFLTLPLYIIAEKWQKAEQQTINKLKPKTEKIKQVFWGDEQYMILSTYYRQNGYHPIYSLRNSLSILIQIPFFIAAYHFLSNFSELNGASFIFLSDLGKPDKLININGIYFNALPVLMTVINCVSGVIYTKNLAFRNKIQIYALSLIFLILLYNSPSGLVLYWTMNNIFSLIKNIFYKFKNPIKVLYVIICIFLSLFIFYLLFYNYGSFKKRLILSIFCFMVMLFPIFFKIYIWLQNYFLTPLIKSDKKRLFLFLISSVTLTLLAGFLIPSSIIASSPEEFSFIDKYQSPLPFIFITLFKSMGFFIFWPSCIYFLFNNKVQSFLTLFFSTTAVIALINAFAFQRKDSIISNTFTYDSLNAITSSGSASVFAVFLIFVFLAVFLFLFKNKRVKIISTSLVLLSFSLMTLSIYNIFTIQKKYKVFVSLKEKELSAISRIQPIFHLSKEKPNIIIIMLDRAIGGFVKTVFDAQPVLYDQFDGFTWFPNTVSFAMHTLMAVPPLWGGYEYTPKEMNRRDSVPLVEKHNEALLVIPKILSDAGYHVTVTDPSMANYMMSNDTSIYEKYENTQGINTKGRYSGLWYSQNFNIDNFVSNNIIRNSLLFSFLKISPPPFRKFIYDDGQYWILMKNNELNEEFINSYAILDFLPNLTAYDSEKPSAQLITNETTHQPIFLQYPSYTPVKNVTDFGTGKYSNDRYFHVNSASYLRIGKWLEELKKNQVYNNSRIIIVSDHGQSIDAGIADTELTIPNERRESYNPVLLFKDFDDAGKLKIDNTFMTNADVPVLALNDIAQLKNPFTGKELRENPKSQGLYITTNHLWQPFKHSKKAYNINNDQWLFVHDDIFNPENWEIVNK